MDEKPDFHLIFQKNTQFQSTNLAFWIALWRKINDEKRHATTFTKKLSIVFLFVFRKKTYLCKSKIFD